jgi:hypothetical protein
VNWRKNTLLGSLLDNHVYNTFKTKGNYMKKILLSVALLMICTQGSFSEEPKMQMRELPQAEMIKQNKEIVALAAKELSKTLPQTIDTYTQLVKVEAIDSTLLYRYEINTGAKSDETVQKEDRTRMKEAVTYGICRSSKRFLDAQINISYLYLSSKSKVELFRFDVTKADCPVVK